MISTIFTAMNYLPKVRLLRLFDASPWMVASLVLAWPLPSLAETSVKPVKFSREMMGMEIRILVAAKKNAALEKAAATAFAEGDRLNMIFSDYESESEVTKFSQSSGSGAAVPLSEELFEVLEYSNSLSLRSKGAFDVTLGPVSRLWRIARFQERLPDQTKLEKALQRTGFEKLVLDPNQKGGKLDTAGMVLDLGGVAKGYIADRMLEVLQAQGFGECLIDAGGDLTIGDSPAGSNGWLISIGGRKHPDLPVLELSNCSVATSGDLEQFLEIDGRRYSHIIDPRTGLGLSKRAQATVIAPNGMLADSLASTCLVTGFARFKELFGNSETIRVYYLVADKSTFSLYEFNSIQ